MTNEEAAKDLIAAGVGIEIARDLAPAYASLVTASTTAIAELTQSGLSLHAARKSVEAAMAVWRTSPTAGEEYMRHTLASAKQTPAERSARALRNFRTVILPALWDSLGDNPSESDVDAVASAVRETWSEHLKRGRE
jgi:hypothetical protein